MTQMVKMCGDNDLDSENVLVMNQITQMCGGNDLDNENVWW